MSDDTSQESRTWPDGNQDNSSGLQSGNQRYWTGRLVSCVFFTDGNWSYPGEGARGKPREYARSEVEFQLRHFELMHKARGM